MTDIATTLKECHAIVWRYRAELEPYWPTPTTEDALLFAFTELGEAVDAHLRSKPEYARNRDKDLSVLDELADCALMVLTALGREWEFKKPLRRKAYPLSDSMWGDLVWSLSNMVDSSDEYQASMGWRLDADRVLGKIATIPGMDLPARLVARLERIKAKRMPQSNESTGFAEFEAFWPAMPDLQGGADLFDQYPVSGEEPK